MAWKIYRRKRYFYAEEVGGTNLRHRYHSKEVRIDRKYNNSTDFTFYMNHSGLVLTKMDKVPFADILDATGTPFVSIMALEDWIDENTGQYSEDAPIVPIIETELTGYNAMYNGVEAFIEVVRLEDGTFDRVIAHLIDGTGTIVDPATPTLITPKSTPKEYDRVIDEWLPICKNGVQYFVQTQEIIDNTTGLPISTIEVWKDKNRNTIPPIAAPYEIGYCAEVPDAIVLIPTYSRATGSNTYAQPFRSLSVTAISNDVTVQGQPLPKGFTTSIDSNENEVYQTDVTVTGLDYFITYIV